MDMNTITKKDFKDIIITHESKAFANFRKPHFEYEQLEELIIQNEQLLNKIELRTAEEKGKYIKFSDGSSLDINDNQYNKYTMYIYRFNFGTVLASECKWFDTCDNEWYYQTLYYFIK